jgi:hypothetical protein
LVSSVTFFGFICNHLPSILVLPKPHGSIFIDMAFKTVLAVQFIDVCARSRSGSFIPTATRPCDGVPIAAIAWTYLPMPLAAFTAGNNPKSAWRSTMRTLARRSSTAAGNGRNSTGGLRAIGAALMSARPAMILAKNAR